MLDGALGCRFPRLLLGIRGLDTALRGPPVVVGRSEVAAAVGYPVAIGQELLLIAEVSLERIRLLLRVEPPCLAHSRSVEAAQRQLPGLGQHAV